MAVHKDKTLSGPIDLDSGSFANIAFKDAHLIYSGGQPPVFDQCSFDNTTFEFRGQASNTVNFLKTMSPTATGMRSIVYGLIPELET